MKLLDELIRMWNDLPLEKREEIDRMIKEADLDAPVVSPELCV